MKNPRPTWGLKCRIDVGLRGIGHGGWRETGHAGLQARDTGGERAQVVVEIPKLWVGCSHQKVVVVEVDGCLQSSGQCWLWNIFWEYDLLWLSYFYFCHFSVDFMKMNITDLFNRFFIVKAQKTKTSVPLSVLIHHQHSIFNTAIHTKVILEVIYCSRTLKTSDKDFLCICHHFWNRSLMESDFWIDSFSI